MSTQQEFNAPHFKERIAQSIRDGGIIELRRPPPSIEEIASAILAIRESRKSPGHEISIHPEIAKLWGLLRASWEFREVTSDEANEIISNALAKGGFGNFERALNFLRGDPLESAAFVARRLSHFLNFGTKRATKFDVLSLLDHLSNDLFKVIPTNKAGLAEWWKFVDAYKLDQSRGYGDQNPMMDTL